MGAARKLEPIQGEYIRPWLYDAQERAIFCAARYGVVEASTKAGKTVGCMAWLVEQAVLNGGLNRNFWWVAPVYPQAKIAFRRIKAGLPVGSYLANESELTIRLLAPMSTIWFKTAEKPDNLYGEDVYAAVIDEASRCREDSWIAVRSTLTATRGPVRIIGNVKGRTNWHYRIARRAESGDDGYHYAKLTAYDAVAGGVLEAAEVEDAKRLLPTPCSASYTLPNRRTTKGTPSASITSLRASAPSPKIVPSPSASTLPSLTTGL
jgi:hypothetical protein